MLTEYTRSQVAKQNESRALWVHHDVFDNLLILIENEKLELIEEVELSMIGGSATALASEIGDVMFLYSKLLSICDESEIPEETKEAVRFCCDIADQAGIDINQAVMMKVVRNDIKYLHSFANNGYDYMTCIQFSKLQYKLMGGDYNFSRMYEEIGDIL